MLPSSECDIPQVVCCQSLFDIADHILTGVYTAMLECFQPTPCNAGGILAYVTMGDGDDLVLDALSVSISQIAPSPASQQQNTLSKFPVYQAEFTVRLLESGWPMAYEDNGEIFVPDPVEQNALARHAYAHGERMYRKLAYMTANGDLVPSGVACTKAVITPLIPMNPSGGSIGWRTSVVLTLPWGS